MLTPTLTKLHNINGLLESFAALLNGDAINTDDTDDLEIFITDCNSYAKTIHKLAETINTEDVKLFFNDVSADS